MDNVVVEAHGVNGQLQLQEDRIRFIRKGLIYFLIPWLKREEEILISQIGAVQLKEASLVTSGFIQFALIGRKEDEGEYIPAPPSHYKVEFELWQSKPFEQIKKVIDEAMRKRAEQTGKATYGLDESWKLSNIIERGVYPPS